MVWASLAPDCDLAVAVLKQTMVGGEQPLRHPSTLRSLGEEGGRSSPQWKMRGRGGPLRGQEAGAGREASAGFQRERLSFSPEGGEGVEALSSDPDPGVQTMAGQQAGG
ncbi:hypothetical protein NDU88_003963 [Pleurodeles waltl]|uniref:Uncharacterized protein n=1 Tax=Pleurodeles waltl TaxID=8319 RepID=A0AAV7T8C7_PLEWA|nr:hypothetical protein NDU88_003963 [Pleurodeles waltl]